MAPGREQRRLPGPALLMAGSESPILVAATHDGVRVKGPASPETNAKSFRVRGTQNPQPQRELMCTVFGPTLCRGS